MFSEEKQERISKHFSRLKDICYLDHVGATLYADSQIQAVARELSENVYGNPHSLSTTSRFSTDIVDQIRYRILQHFNTSPDKYSVIFTSGATQALKIVAESFDWTNDHLTKSCHENGTTENITNGVHNEDKSQHANLKYTGSAGTFMYLQDNHTSVLGMRELARKAGATVISLSHEESFRCFQDCTNEFPRNTFDGNSLFVYPAQSNFSGVKYPLSWISKVQEGVLNKKVKNGKRSKWFCLLDAASFLSTNPLDLSQVQPDFICLSFYKIFGYPTGLGALLVKNDSAFVLKRTYFGGGTVLMCLSSECTHIQRPGLSERFEDGTLPFLSIMAVHHGFLTLYELAGNMASIAQHTFSLAQYLFNYLLTLHHSNGAPAVVLYCDTDYEDVKTQGNVVTFNMLRSSGEYIGFTEILNMASLNGIQLRTGCFCNPGACQRHLGLSNNDIKAHFEAGHVCGDEKHLVNGQPTGTIRVSFGYMTIKKDVDKLINVLTCCFVQGSPLRKLPSWWPYFKEVYLSKFDNKHQSDVSLQSSPKLAIKRNAFISPQVTSRPLPRQIKSVPKNVMEVKSVPKEVADNGCMSLTHMFIYPVKSCGALSVESWIIGPRGFLFDREWMIVTFAGVCLTQKQESNLCLVKPKIDLGNSLLILQFPDMPDISVPLDPPSSTNDKLKELTLCQSKVCGDRIQGWDCGDEVAVWLSEALGRHGLRLIRQWSSDLRVFKGNKKSLTAEKEKPVISLSNQAQFLLINNSSIQWLSDQLDEAQADCDKKNLLDRFRSNLVIQGAEALEETEWTYLQIGNVKFQSEGPCTRCQMICIDQSTGEKTQEPMRTLAAALHGKMRFGVYLNHKTDGENVKISVGDKVISSTVVN